MYCIDVKYEDSWKDWFLDPSDVKYKNITLYFNDESISFIIPRDVVDIQFLAKKIKVPTFKVIYLDDINREIKATYIHSYRYWLAERNEILQGFNMKLDFSNEKTI